LGLRLLTGPFAPQQPGSEPLAPPLESRVQTLAKGLRCAVCQGLSVADSPSSMARAQLDKVRELVAGGRSDAEVKDYFVARYGEWVLLKPPTTGLNLAVWIGPVALVLLGALAIARQLRKGAPPTPPAITPSSTDTNGPATQGSASASDPYLSAVRSELDR
jgi:cytochrome c-type biogenesis protein CcmH